MTFHLAALSPVVRAGVRDGETVASTRRRAA